MIGIFDSGLGGLSVLEAVRHQLPEAELCYVADTAHVPYGNKSDAQIEARVLAIGGELVQRGATVLVVACNTATVAAIESLRRRYPDIPVVGVEPGVKPAALSSRSGHIAVLATESTARSARLAHLIALHAEGLETHVVACPGWATQVEQLRLDDPALAADVHDRIQPLLAVGVDRFVLGCTHYSFLVPLLQPLVAGQAELVEVAEAVAKQVARLYRGPRSGASRARLLLLLATAFPERLAAALPRLGLAQLAACAQECGVVKV